jgi:hypothetical protein
LLQGGGIVNKELMIGTGILAGALLTFIFRRSLRRTDGSELKEKLQRRGEGEGRNAAEVATIDPRPETSGEVPAGSR